LLIYHSSLCTCTNTHIFIHKNKNVSCNISKAVKLSRYMPWTYAPHPRVFITGRRCSDVCPLWLPAQCGTYFKQLSFLPRSKRHISTPWHHPRNTSRKPCFYEPCFSLFKLHPGVYDNLSYVKSSIGALYTPVIWYLSFIIAPILNF
jgi:hypothetical protein